MLEKVKTFWVEGVLEQSLHGAALIELGLEKRPDDSVYPWDMVVQKPDQPSFSLPPGTKIVDIFDDMKGSLLILGEPGSGKTTMLLELARVTIARAENDPSLPIPVVLNLSSWAEKRLPFAQWLIDELTAKYRVSNRIAQSWVENDELLLLLDGLDEVAQASRERCVEAINRFQQGRSKRIVPLAICSRTQEFTALATQLNLEGAVVLQPLTLRQVDGYLETAGVEFTEIRETLRRDTTLQELSQSPLMLSIMTLTYRGRSLWESSSVGSVAEFRKNLLNSYIDAMFARMARTKSEPYSKKQTIGWLSWLAKQMTRHSQTVFLIERMQPSWLQASKPSYVTSLLLIFGLIFGLIGWLIGWMIVGFTGGLFIALFIGNHGGLIVWLIEGLTGEMRDIKPVEKLRLSWSWQGAKKGLIFGLTGGLIVGLIVGVMIGLGFGLFSGNLFGLGLGLGLGLFGGLIGGLVFGLFGGLVFGLFGGLIDSEDIERTHNPNQGIRQSLRNGIIFMLVFMLVFGLIGGLIGGNLIGLFVGLGFGLFGGLFGGGFACIQHFTLRLLLYTGHHIPWNYAKFLDYAAERIFLRKVGGSYIFVHRLLMDHVAAMTDEDIARLSRDS